MLLSSPTRPPDDGRSTGDGPGRGGTGRAAAPALSTDRSVSGVGGGAGLAVRRRTLGPGGAAPLVALAAARPLGLDVAMIVRPLAALLGTVLPAHRAGHL